MLYITNITPEKAPNNSCHVHVYFIYVAGFWGESVKCQVVLFFLDLPPIMALYPYNILSSSFSSHQRHGILPSVVPYNVFHPSRAGTNT